MPPLPETAPAAPRVRPLLLQLSRICALTGRCDQVKTACTVSAVFRFSERNEVY